MAHEISSIGHDMLQEFQDETLSGLTPGIRVLLEQKAAALRDMLADEGAPIRNSEDLWTAVAMGRIVAAEMCRLVKAGMPANMAEHRVTTTLAAMTVPQELPEGIYFDEDIA